jgi:uncharacterized membrane protein
MKLDKRTILIVILLLGIADASYLTYVHFAPSALKCPTLGSAIVDCEQVLTSSFSNIFGVPLAVIGLVWFLASLFMVFFGFDKIVKNIWMIFGIGGVLYSITAQSILGKICLYCISLDILIILSVILFLSMKNRK